MRTTRRAAPTTGLAKGTLCRGLQPHPDAQRMVAAMADLSTMRHDFHRAAGSLNGKPLIAPEKDAHTRRTSHRAIDRRIREHHEPFGDQ